MRAGRSAVRAAFSVRSAAILSWLSATRLRAAAMSARDSGEVVAPSKVLAGFDHSLFQNRPLLAEAAMEKALAPAPESRRRLRVAMPTAHEEPPPAAPPVPPTPTQPPAPAPPLPSDGEVPEPPVFCASPTTPESAEPVAPAVVAGLAADEMGQLSLLSWVAPPRDGEQLSLF